MNKPFAQRAFDIFAQATAAYHQADNVDAPEQNPFEPGSIEHTLFAKNHVDAVQWHLEDIIRAPAWWRSSTPTSARSTPA